MEKRKCKYYDVCRLFAETDEDPPLCILHSKNPNKDVERFRPALREHRKAKGDNFRHIFFPVFEDFFEAIFSEEADFFDATFSEDADFSEAKFSKDADFSEAKFLKRANFFEATFSEMADFSGATFSEDADFLEAMFLKGANFSGAKFSEMVHFYTATFSEDAIFSAAKFLKEVDFSEAMFSKGVFFLGVTFLKGAHFYNATFSKRANFLEAKFLGRTTFIGRYKKDKKHIPVFWEVKNEVDFRGVNVDPPQALIFRDADLTKCRFEQTDLRKAEFTGVIWPKRERRVCVYDEIAPIEPNEARKWDHIERLYRELKQNCEDRRDYERAGDFHYGEKEMRRKNPNTPVLLKVLLTLYCWVSGYGERYIRPLVWSLGLMVVCTFWYLYFGIETAKGGTALALSNWKDWFRVGLYSLQVMALLKPTYLIPLGTKAIFVKVVQSLLGPIFIGLFALAVRQRLKR